VHCLLCYDEKQHAKDVTNSVCPRRKGTGFSFLFIQDIPGASAKEEIRTESRTGGGGVDYERLKKGVSWKKTLKKNFGPGGGKLGGGGRQQNHGGGWLEKATSRQKRMHGRKNVIVTKGFDGWEASSQS